MKQPPVKHEVLIVTDEQRTNSGKVLVGIEESISMGMRWDWILKSVSYRVEL